MDSIILYLAAFFVGILPAIFWVWFWNREDRLHPEPKRVIAMVFVSGMITVAMVIPLQFFIENFGLEKYPTMFLWVAAEEILKFSLAYLVVLHNRKIADEPIDMVIYMLTVAFGFAAAENVLFLLTPMSTDGILAGLLTGNLRFIGATLLHALASAIVGVAMALTFYKSRLAKIFAMLIGLALAIVVHFVFNMFLLGAQSNLLQIFVFVWVGFVFLLVAIQKVKRIHR